MSDIKTNDFSSWIENNYGKLEFGTLDPDNVRHATYLGNKQDVRHRFFMDIDHPGAKSRTAPGSYTTLESPGGITIKCGQDRDRADVVFNIQVENGKLAMTCQTGDVEILGKNVTIEAKGNSTDDGVITLKSNSKISLDAPKVDINGKQSCQINSEQKLGLKTNGTMDFYATQGTCESASSRYGKRGPAQVESLVEQAKGVLESEAMGGLMDQAAALGEDLLNKAPGMIDQASDQLNKAMKDNLKNLPF